MRIEVRIEGPGYLDCHPYRQGERLLLHVVHLSGTDVRPGYLDEYLPVGLRRMSIDIGDLAPRRVELRVGHEEPASVIEDGWLSLELERVTDHELLVIE